MSRALRHVAPTLVDAVRALSGDRSRGFVFVRPDGTERLWTFHELAIEAGHRGANLAAKGLEKGDRLALVIPDGDEFVLSFLGALFAGIVPVPIYPPLSFKNAESYSDSVTQIVRASGATALVTTAATRPHVASVMSRVGSLRAILTVDELAGGSETIDTQVCPDDLALLQFTSGSTSRPKGVMVTHGNLAANAEAFMIDGLRRDPTVDKGLSWLPLFHDMGLIGFVVGPLFTHVPCVFVPTASFVRAPRLWLDKIHQHRATITYAPNFAYALVAKRLRGKDLGGLDLSCIRVCGCGAEPIQAGIIRDFLVQLAPAGLDPRALLASYGMAEATLAITFVPLRDGLRTDRIEKAGLSEGRADPSDVGTELVDCGEPFPAHEVAIVNEAGQRLGERQVGEIVVRGPSVTKGYFAEPELTARAYKALRGDESNARPWLHTGDLGYLAGGRLFVCGRIKDVIIVRGRNYYPSDIEWAVSELPSVRRGNVVAFGLGVDASGRAAHDGTGEERVVVCCEAFASEASSVREAARACVAARFGLTVLEVVVTPPAALPRTSSGKLQRGKTRQMYLSGTLQRARAVQGPEDMDGPTIEGARETQAS
jgi:fatty-acyl-CoA synthase